MRTIKMNIRTSIADKLAGIKVQRREPEKNTCFGVYVS